MQVYNDSLCTGLAGSLAQALCPWYNQARDWAAEPFFVCLVPSIALSCANLGAAGDEIWGRGRWSFPMRLLSLYFDGGKETQRGRSGKDFPLHKENERGNRVSVASCQAPGMRQPWELASGQTPQRLLTWENWLSDCCQECRQWSFGYFTFESLAFVLLSPKVTFIGHLCMHAKR